MSEKVLVDREQLERAASVIAWMSCRSDIKAADLKRLEQCASELSCALTAPVVQAEPVAVAITEKQVMTAYLSASRLHISGTSNWVAAFAQSLNKQIAAPPAHPDVPRCQCCGYLVTESEHRGCLRSASPHPDASVLVEALRAARHLLALHSGEAMPAYDAMQVVDRIDAALAGKGGAR